MILFRSAASALRAIAVVGAACGLATAANADDLFKRSRWANIASDLRAAEAGDILTVIVYQNAEARNAAQNSAQRGRNATGVLSSDALQQNGQFGMNGDYLGKGEIRRSESFVTEISVRVEEVLPNGDLLITGEQVMRVNGERTHIAIRGRVRPTDVNRDNQVLSTRIADAEIDYDGEGFVSRNADSGPLGWLFSLLGLSG